MIVSAGSVFAVQKLKESDGQTSQGTDSSRSARDDSKYGEEKDTSNSEAKTDRGSDSDTSKSSSDSSDAAPQASKKTDPKTQISNKAPQSQPTTNLSHGTSQAPEQSQLIVSLSVNGSARGSVKLAPGSNQCNVLSTARQSGLISSLDMRYSSQYGTMGVYVIDGIGDPNTIRWTYQVNGKSPPYGCSRVAARNGDTVNWRY